MLMPQRGQSFSFKNYHWFLFDSLSKVEVINLQSANKTLWVAMYHLFNMSVNISSKIIIIFY